MGGTEGRHEVARAIIDRRSWRVYTEAGMTQEDSLALERAASLAPSVLGSRSARVEVITGDQVGPLIGALTTGLIGKGNPWLFSAPPAGFAVLVGDSARGAREADRHFYNVDAAVAGELVVLTATTRGLASCWLAAINSGEAARHLGLGRDDRIPAVVALGHGGVRRKGSLLAAGWDRITRVAVSQRRKPVEKICFLDRFDSGRTLPAADLGSLQGDARSLLDVVESLEPASSFGGVDPGERDLGLVVESMRLAPSADNGQTWRFVVVRGRDRTVELMRAAGFVVPLDAAPAAVLAVAAAPFIVSHVRREQPFALIDHPIALTHAVLVATTLGLRWNLSFVFDYQAVRALTGFPASHQVTALLALDREGELGAPPHPDMVQLFR
jgi:nitroreductase